MSDREVSEDPEKETPTEAFDYSPSDQGNENKLHDYDPIKMIPEKWPMPPSKNESVKSPAKTGVPVKTKMPLPPIHPSKAEVSYTIGGIETDADTYTFFNKLKYKGTLEADIRDKMKNGKITEGTKFILKSRGPALRTFVVYKEGGKFRIKLKDKGTTRNAPPPPAPSPSSFKKSSPKNEPPPSPANLPVKANPSSVPAEQGQRSSPADKPPATPPPSPRTPDGTNSETSAARGEISPAKSPVKASMPLAVTGSVAGKTLGKFQISKTNLQVFFASFKR